jgi:single-stranded DNA-binding protein
MVTGQIKQSSYEKDGVEKTRLEITADNIGIVHRVKREAQPTEIWSSSPQSASVAADDDLPF